MQGKLLIPEAKKDDTGKVEIIVLCKFKAIKPPYPTFRQMRDFVRFPHMFRRRGVYVLCASVLKASSRTLRASPALRRPLHLGTIRSSCSATWPCLTSRCLTATSRALGWSADFLSSFSTVHPLSTPP